MSESLITPIFTIIGIVVGSVIPSLMKFLENKVEYSRENKQKHEEITRKMLADFIPKLRHASWVAKKYLKDKGDGLVVHSSPMKVSERFDAAQEYYDDNIKDFYPLEMHSKITELMAVCGRLNLLVGLDEHDTDQYNSQITGGAEKFDRLIDNLAEHIEKNYI